MRLKLALSLLLTIILGTAMPALAQDITESKNISYIEGSDNFRQSLDIYAPAKTEESNDQSAKYPVHIFVHGGGWIRGNKDTVKAADAKTYTDNGIIVVSLNYRLASKDAPFPAMMEDIAAALHWVKNNIENYQGDASRIVISGHSAGAHLVALLATDLSYLKAQELSPSDFKAFIAVDTASYDVTGTLPIEGEGRLINFMRMRAFGNDESVRKKASPLHQANAETAHNTPIVLYTTAERPQAVEGTQSFMNALKEHGYSASITILDNNLNHEDMKDEIFNIESPIFHAIAEYTNN